MDKQQVYIKDRKTLRQWLQKHHIQSEAIWLVYDKTKDGKRSLTYDDIVEEALCFGWIDSTAKSLNDTQAMIYFCPRKPKSVWSKVNKERVERLIESGLMTQTGLDAIEISKQTGGWTALDAIERLEMPKALEEEFKNHKKARENFDKFSNSSKKNIYYWVSSAKTAETIKKRVVKTIEMAARSVRANIDKE